MAICPSSKRPGDAYGPVIIDLPQAVDAAWQTTKCRAPLLDRTSTTLDPEYLPASTRQSCCRHVNAKEMVGRCIEEGELTPDTELTGHFEGKRLKPRTSTRWWREIKAVLPKERRPPGKICWEAEDGRLSQAFRRDLPNPTPHRHPTPHCYSSFPLSFPRRRDIHFDFEGLAAGLTSP